MTTSAQEPRRETAFFLARVEKRVLVRIAAALPDRVLPDHLTLLAMAAAAWIAVAYMLSNSSETWLWAASAGLVVHWFGDSLDGTLARVRRIERPRYGFYVDHLADAFSTFAIGLGLGLSPFMLLSVGLAVVIAYLVLSINVYLEAHAFGRFRFSYGRFGPTEARIVLIAANTLAFIVGPIPFRVVGLGVSLYDVLGALVAASMTVLLLRRVYYNLRALSREEPPASKRVSG
jgi:phosphatidylglycerophosphate synthase